MQHPWGPHQPWWCFPGVAGAQGGRLGGWQAGARAQALRPRPGRQGGRGGLGGGWEHRRRPHAPAHHPTHHPHTQLQPPTCITRPFSSPWPCTGPGTLHAGQPGGGWHVGGACHRGWGPCPAPHLAPQPSQPRLPRLWGVGWAWAGLKRHLRPAHTKLHAKHPAPPPPCTHPPPHTLAHWTRCTPSSPAPRPFHPKPWLL